MDQDAVFSLMSPREKLRLIDRYCDNYHLSKGDITFAMIMDHWNLERDLAEKMRSCPENNRAVFFKECYDKLYHSCPWLVPTGIAQHSTDDWITWWVHYSLSMDARILEIGGGAGNCAKRIQKKGFSVTCIDLSDERVVQATQEPVPDIRFQAGDATILEFPSEEFTVVYSHQMVEHLHPDDISRHFTEVYRVLKKGGFYYFTTPNRLFGPFDISRLFGFQTAGGMHLKEYSYDEISAILQKAGFVILESPVIHPYLCDKLGIFPPLADARKKIRLESVVKKIPGFLKDLAGRIVVVKSIMILARK